MIGISFAYPDAADRFRHPPWTELKCARIEPGPELILADGKKIDGWYWRAWNIPLEERKQIMNAVVKNLVGSHEVDGFTLWWNWTRKMWQMNIRRKEGHWQVSYVSQAEAEAIFATLQAHDALGPWKVNPDYVQDDKAAKADVESERRSFPAARAEREIEESFEEPKPVDLLDVLRAAEEAVQRGNKFLAGWIGG